MLVHTRDWGRGCDLNSSGGKELVGGKRPWSSRWGCARPRAQWGRRCPEAAGGAEGAEGRGGRECPLGVKWEPLAVWSRAGARCDLFCKQVALAVGLGTDRGGTGSRDRPGGP